VDELQLEVDIVEYRYFVFRLHDSYKIVQSSNIDACALRLLKMYFKYILLCKEINFKS